MCSVFKERSMVVSVSVVVVLVWVRLAAEEGSTRVSDEMRLVRVRSFWSLMD